MSVHWGGRGPGHTSRLAKAVAAAGTPTQDETTALIARFTTPPDATRTTKINDLIYALKTAGVWAKLDALYVMAAADAQAAQRNWIADAFNLTPTSSPTFDADRGYTGNGTSSYLDTGFNPTTQAATAKYIRDSAHVGLWSRSSGQISSNNSGKDMGATTLLGLWLRGTADTAAWAINSTIGSIGNLVTAANTDGSGHFLFNRSTSSALQSYRNGGSLGTSTKTSTGIPNSNITIGKSGASQFVNRQFAAAHIGQSLDATETAAFYTALQAYMTAVGA